MGCLPGGVAKARLHRRRRRATGGCVAILGDHHGARHQRGVADGLASGFVSPHADDDLPQARTAVGGASAVALGDPGVLSRVQHREWRRRARVRSIRGIAMTTATAVDGLGKREAPLAMEPAEFRDIGHRLVDEIADQLARVPARPVTRNESPPDVRAAFGAELPLPSDGSDAAALVTDATALLFDHATFNAH